MAHSFDRADAGERVLIRRRRQLYTIVPVKEESEITPALARKIAKAKKEMRDDKCVTLRTHEDIDNFFESL